MRYYSTTGKANSVSFREALFRGLAPDGGLYMPESVPEMGVDYLRSITTYPELAAGMIRPFVQTDISEARLDEITTAAFTFDVPLVKLNNQVGILELFHGPTLAFKDFAARFMARTMEYFLQNEDRELTVLVATSGDTGSAVANGFLGMDGIRVVILYPSGWVSRIQEQQLTTLGRNITALEVDGSFDDCQRMVKAALLDDELMNKYPLSSANSINIARLLPQSVYYAWAWKQSGGDKAVVISVPCGNFGNLTGGLLAKRMGVPLEYFIAATNANDVFTTYLVSGEFHPQASQQTLSSAMDVGRPSNLDRIQNLYNYDVTAIRKDMVSWGFSDEDTRLSIRNTKEKTGYLTDPHTAVGVLGLERYLKKYGSSQSGIVLSTAHPGKFADLLEPIIGENVPIPERLGQCLGKQKKATLISNRSSDLKEFLWQD